MEENSKICSSLPEGCEKGIIPELERYLLKARKDTRIKIKYKTVVTKSGEEFAGVYDKDKGEVKTPAGKQAIPKMRKL